LCGAKKNVFLGTKVPRQRNPIVAFKVDKNKKEAIEKGGAI
jgi:hypothetical protein